MFKVMYVMRLISLNADYTTAVLCMQFHSFPDYCSRGISSQLSAKPLHHKVITIHLQILWTGKYWQCGSQSAFKEMILQGPICADLQHIKRNRSASNLSEKCAMMRKCIWSVNCHSGPVVSEASCRSQEILLTYSKQEKQMTDGSKYDRWQMTCTSKCQPYCHLAPQKNTVGSFSRN